MFCKVAEKRIQFYCSAKKKVLEEFPAGKVPFLGLTLTLTGGFTRGKITGGCPGENFPDTEIEISALVII